MVFSVGRNEVMGERMKKRQRRSRRRGWRGGGQQQSGTDRHPHRLCFLLHKARPPCVRNLSFNLIPHTSSLGEGGVKKKRIHVKHQHISKTTGLSKRSISIRRGERETETAWTAEREVKEEEVVGEKERQKHPRRFPRRPVCFSLFGAAAISPNNSFCRQRETPEETL